MGSTTIPGFKLVEAIKNIMLVDTGTATSIAAQLMRKFLEYAEGTGLSSFEVAPLVTYLSPPTYIVISKAARAAYVHDVLGGLEFSSGIMVGKPGSGKSTIGVATAMGFLAGFGWSEFASPCFASAQELHPEPMSIVKYLILSGKKCAWDDYAKIVRDRLWSIGLLGLDIEQFLEIRPPIIVVDEAWKELSGYNWAMGGAARKLYVAAAKTIRFIKDVAGVAILITQSINNIPKQIRELFDYIISLNRQRGLVQISVLRYEFDEARAKEVPRVVARGIFPSYPRVAMHPELWRRYMEVRAEEIQRNIKVAMAAKEELEGEATGENRDEWDEVEERVLEYDEEE